MRYLLIILILFSCKPTKPVEGQKWINEGDTLMIKTISTSAFLVADTGNSVLTEEPAYFLWDSTNCRLILHSQRLTGFMIVFNCDSVHKHGKMKDTIPYDELNRGRLP